MAQDPFSATTMIALRPRRDVKSWGHPCCCQQPDYYDSRCSAFANNRAACDGAWGCCLIWPGSNTGAWC
eukprot:8341795-Karenia_brevis.AAC.1